MIPLGRLGEVLEASAHRHGPVHLTTEEALAATTAMMSIVLQVHAMNLPGPLRQVQTNTIFMAAGHVLRHLGMTPADVEAAIHAVQADLGHPLPAGKPRPL